MISRQRVSFDKSRISFSSNVPSNLTDQRYYIAGVLINSDMGVYFRVPTIYGRITKPMFKNWLDKVRARLAIWKAKFLFLTGRITLGHSDLNLIPFYTMQVVQISISVFNELDKICSFFIWGHDANTMQGVFILLGGILMSSENVRRTWFKVYETIEQGCSC